MYSDSHTHLASFPADQVPALVKQAETKGLTVIQAWGENLDSSAVCINFAGMYKEVYAGVGIHPWNAVVLTDDLRKRFEELAGKKRVVAIGELGLDYVRNPNNKDVQQESMKYQVAYALKHGLAVDVHNRGAHEDIMSILRPQVKAGLKGMAHGFVGDLSELKDWLAIDFYISIGVRGFVTGELPHMQDVVKQTPLDRLLTETDMGNFGEHTGPSAAIAVAEKIAKVRGSTPDEIGAVTTQNLKRILKIV